MKISKRLLEIFQWQTGIRWYSSSLDKNKSILIPIVECLLYRNSFVFYCQYCKTLHSHGPRPGLRSAHCTNRNSKFIQTGYFLQLKNSKSFMEDSIK